MLDDEKKERKNVSFVYLDKMSRKAIAENITITKDMPEIDFSSWQDLGNDYYAIRLTDYSEYKKMMDYYGIRKLTHDNDFEHIFATIIVRKNVNNSISAEEVTVDASGVNLKVKTGDPVEIDENVKYPGLVVYTPNYMNLDGVTNLNIIVE